MDKISSLIQKLSHDIVDVRLRSANSLIFKLQHGIIGDTIVTSSACVLDILNGVDSGLGRLAAEGAGEKENNALVLASSSICDLLLPKISLYDTKVVCTALASILQKFYFFLSTSNLYCSTKFSLEKVKISKKN